MRLNCDKERTLIERWNEGVTREAIASELSVTTGYVQYWTRKLGLRARPRGWNRRSSFNLDKLRDLWSAEPRIPVTKIARELHVTSLTIRRWQKRLNLPARGQTELRVFNIDGVTLASDLEYDFLKVQSEAIMETLEQLRANKFFEHLEEHIEDKDDRWDLYYFLFHYDSLLVRRVEEEYRRLGKQMSKHLRVLKVRPLEGPP